MLVTNDYARLEMLQRAKDGNTKSNNKEKGKQDEEGYVAFKGYIDKEKEKHS